MRGTSDEQHARGPFPTGTVFHITGGGFRTLFPPKVYATDGEIEGNSVTILYEVERITGGN